MGTKLVVDLTALGGAASRLAIIATDFASTNERLEEVTASMGRKNETHRLRKETEAFGHRWKVRREELQESVDYLSKMASDVAQNLGEVDTDLATQLTAQPAPPPMPTGPLGQRAI
ncbi:MAG: hypothetical protein CVT64_03155 [Actinobacteria bacterium HGW-Actinobacteria-4]|nr:MAG: hypothetical protein CVT64_03155 [Actinobacteria bacterium HGW-Actinobacteria-4]